VRPKAHQKRLVLVSFPLFLRYPPLTTDPEQKLSPAEPDDLADTLCVEAIKTTTSNNNI